MKLLAAKIIAKLKADNRTFKTLSIATLYTLTSSLSKKIFENSPNHSLGGIKYAIQHLSGHNVLPREQNTNT